MSQEKNKSKFEEWKSAVKNTPPERLLKINMQGYILQSIGLLIVCTILLFRGSWWWLIFAFIFSIWNNVSGFISAWKQYDEVVSLKKEMGIVEEDKSLHRNKASFIKSKLGKKAGWISIILSVLISYSSVSYFGWQWYHKTIMILCVFILYYFIYFKLGYSLAKRK